MMIRFCLWLTVGLLMLSAASVSRAGVDDEHWSLAEEAIEGGLTYLRQQQNEDGSWSPDPAGPAVTALVLNALLNERDVGDEDEQVEAAVAFILSHRQEDGGIYDRILANYNTAIVLSAFSHLTHRPEVAEAVAEAQAFLKDLQWQAGDVDPQGEAIDEDHPFYGGVGYGTHGRPDLSNLQLMLQGLYDSGVDCDDPAFQRALVFLQRVQGHESNDLFDEQTVERDGGFIYATSIDSDNIGTPQSMANPDQVEAGREGRAVSGLRTYGSMTYAGFKSYIYADLDRDDPRVEAAWDWIRHNYTLQRNPGMPEPIEAHGLYYYYHTFARALGAWGGGTLETAEGEGRNWANDLVAVLAERQREDGSWRNEADRWMEDDDVLVTAYAVLALQEAVR